MFVLSRPFSFKVLFNIAQDFMVNIYEEIEDIENSLNFDFTIFVCKSL